MINYIKRIIADYFKRKNYVELPFTPEEALKLASENAVRLAVEDERRRLEYLIKKGNETIIDAVDKGCKINVELDINNLEVNAAKKALLYYSNLGWHVKFIDQSELWRIREPSIRQPYKLIIKAEDDTPIEQT